MKTFQKTLQQLKDRNRLRSLNKAEGIDLTSNDYLGMRNHPALKIAALEAISNGIEIGASGSRLLRGQCDAHESLETFAATHFGSEKALYFANGFLANYALFTTLPDRHDCIIYDSLLHASARDGINASNARSIKAEHNDLQSFEDAIKRAKDSFKGHIWVAVESLYSMDGDSAPLTEIQKLCADYDAYLIVDEAHSTGVFGNRGKGLSESLKKENLIELHTCGKAVGVAGGLICASADIVDYMINKSRPFIYSTAPMPLQAHLTQTSLEILASKDGDKRRSELQNLVKFFKTQYQEAESHIVPIILGDDASAVQTATAMQEAGYDIRAIRPPTVPEGTARLRLSLSTNLNTATLEQFFGLLSNQLQKKAA